MTSYQPLLQTTEQCLVMTSRLSGCQRLIQCDVSLKSNMVCCEFKMVANLYFQPHYTTSQINLHSRSKQFLIIINISFSFVQNACRNICIRFVRLSLRPPLHPTTRNNNRASSNKPKWKQTHIWGGRRVSIVFTHALIYSFLHSFVRLFIHPFHLYLSESPSKELSHETRGKQRVAVRAGPRRQKANIQWCAA